MSAILPRLQSAFLKWLVTESGSPSPLTYSLALETKATSITAIPNGVRADLNDGVFVLNFYSGFGNEQAAIPAIFVVCNNSSSDVDTPGIENADVTISLEYQVDDSTTTPSAVAALEGATRWLTDLLWDSPYLISGLEAAEPGIIVMSAYGKSSSMHTDGEKRIRSVQFDFKVTASI
jgi:hypothetical protein